jgi:hypothetical protein
MSTTIVIGLIAGLLAQSPPQKPAAPAGASDRAPDPADAAARLAIMQRSLSSFRIQSAEDRGAPFRLQPEPIFRFNNPVGNSKDGAIFLWLGEFDRPEVAVQVFLRRYDDQWVQEFTSLAPSRLTGQHEDGAVWSPAVAGVQLKLVPGAPRPAENVDQRLRQMRLLAQDFVAEDHFQRKSWQRLRLLAKPLARYGRPGTNLIDGALFSFVLGTDPEVYLMLEARAAKGGAEWQFALAPMSTYALKAAYKGQEVWSVPLRSNPDRGPDKPFFVRLFDPGK